MNEANTCPEITRFIRGIEQNWILIFALAGVFLWLAIVALWESRNSGDYE